ncbi:hypothetical protein CRM22_000159 [Opisthorchis felineus]|uniref:Adenylate kinase 9 n=1 Tax=Opisthorchis felineus TaxID=147828 RepID=A0A4S2MGA4_OPIFE|nr:hypothetical protein CRM22_000159 [Opisthorchis felineus]
MLTQPQYLKPYRTKSQQRDQEEYRQIDQLSKEEGILRFLHKKPLCVLILGHPCTGKTLLAKKLSEKWKLQFINATELIINHLDENDQLGKSLAETLVSGEALKEEIVFSMIHQKLKSPECAHYGYVLDDLPTYGRTYLTTEEQLNYIETLRLTPDIIVSIKIPGEDLRKRREGMRVDPLNGEKYGLRSYEPEPAIQEEPKELNVNISAAVATDLTEATGEHEFDADDPEAMEEEGGMTMELGHPDFPKTNREINERLFVQIEDLPETIEEDTSYYRQNVKHYIKSFISRRNPLNVIELDGNQTPTEQFYNLMTRLQAMNLYPSVAPVRFFSAATEEEEVPEDMETDELFKTLATRKMPGPRCRWKRTAWQRFCPVALYKGYLAQGKPEFTVGFLGGIYCMSSAEHLASFMLNPRPYLLPPQPRPPFRLMVVGSTASGKSSVIRMLAESYGARVLDINETLQMEQDKVMAERLAQVAAETEAEVIKELKERREQEMLQLKTNKMIEDATDGVVDTVALELEREAVDMVAETADESEADGETLEVPEEELATAHPLTPLSRPVKALYIPEHLLQPIDGNHHEVKVRVRDAVNKAKKIPVELDVDLYLNEARNGIEEAEKKLQAENPTGPFHGNWILDGMPLRAAVWENLIQKAPELVPDVVVCLMDRSEDSEFILRRWYKYEREGLKARNTVLSEESTDKEVSEDIETIPAGTTPDADEINELQPDPLPPPGHQRDGAIEKLKEDADQWKKSGILLRGHVNEYGIPVDVFDVDIADKSFDQLRDEVLIHLKKPFTLPPVEVSQEELEEGEEEDAEAFEEEADEFAEELGEQEEEEGGEEEGNEKIDEGEEATEEEEENTSRNMLKKLGLTSYFCPVTLHDHGVLRAGDPDVGAIFDNLVYYFSNEEARAKFMGSPESILFDVERPIHVPALRILLLGPPGCGKTLHGRQLATALDIFHVDFNNILQEIVLPKVGKKLGKEHEDEQPIPELVLPNLEEGVTPSSADGPTIDKYSDVIGYGATKEELTENEQNVVEYLLKGTPLPPETMEWILGKYWTKEPYKSTGFILEGFPMSADELQFLVDSNYFPDFAVFLNTDVGEVISRLLPIRLDFWRKRMAKKAANAAELKAWKARKKEITREKRRGEILAELQARRENARSGRASLTGGEDDEEHLDDEVDIDEILANEDEEQGEEMNAEEEETEADAIDRLRDEISERYEEKSDNLAELLEQLDELSVPKFEIESGGKVTWARYRLVKRINAFIENRRSLFERVYPVSPKVAERLIANGYRFPSRFGRWCPVTLLLQNSILPPLMVPLMKTGNPKYLPVLPGLPGVTLPVSKPNTCSAIYKENIYWFANQAARAMFMKNPLKFVQGTPDPPIHMPLRMAIVGAPKTGKTTLAKRLCQEYNVPIITVTEAIRWYLMDPSHAFTAVAENIRLHMSEGKTVPDILVAGVMQSLTRNSIYSTRGYILDGYPSTVEQCKSLYTCGIRPCLMVELTSATEAERQDLISRGIRETIKQPADIQTAVEDEQELQTRIRLEEGFQRPLPESNVAEELSFKINAYHHAADYRRDWATSHQGLLVDLCAVDNRWCLWRQILRVVRHRMDHLQTYMANILDGKAASIAELGIEERHFKMHASELLHYCPVSWKERGELEDTIHEPKHDLVVVLNVGFYPKEDLIQSCNAKSRSVGEDFLQTNEGHGANGINICIPTSLKFAAEYQGRYYRMAGPNELEKFLSQPENYVPPQSDKSLPSEEKLPFRLQSDAIELSRDAFPMQVALRGYCPVCYINGNQRYEGLKLGVREYLARYDAEIYTFCSNECLLKFLRKPTSYENLTLPHKLPPMPSPIEVHSLPLPGFLEQTVAFALQRALSAAGQHRPKFPFLGIKRSALIYLGLHMKAYNPRSAEQEKQKYQQKLSDFLDSCSLPKWLARNMPLQFQLEHKRTPKLTPRIQQFLELQSFQDTVHEWIKTPGWQTIKPAARGIRFSLTNPFDLK